MIPAFPLLAGTFFTSQSMVSYVSVLSSVSRGPSKWVLCDRNVDELAFREIASANVLVDEDEAFLLEGFRLAQHRTVVVDAVGRDRVRRALHQERIGLAAVLGNVDGGEQLDAVAHGNAVVVLGVVGASVFELPYTLRNRRRLGKKHGRRKQCR